MRPWATKRLPRPDRSGRSRRSRRSRGWRRSDRGWAPGSRRHPNRPRAPRPPRLPPDAPQSHVGLRWASRRDTHGVTLESYKIPTRWNFVGSTTLGLWKACLVSRCVNLPCRLKEAKESKAAAKCNIGSPTLHRSDCSGKAHWLEKSPI